MPAPTGRPTVELAEQPVPRDAAAYRPTVEEAERYLLDKGYDPGPVDGYMTEQTRQALRACAGSSPAESHFAKQSRRRSTSTGLAM